MNLYLVQHADAKKTEEDPDRPLSEKGWADIRKVAFFVKRYMHIHASSIIHSGKTRARQTAEVLAEQFKPASGVKSAEGLEPMADPKIWIKKLKGMHDDIIIVGHLPYLEKLASNLISQDENQKAIAFKNAGIICLNRNEEGLWLVSWIVIPQMIVDNPSGVA